MTNQKEILKNIAQLTSASWGVVLRLEGQNFDIESTWGIKKALKNNLAANIKNSTLDNWIRKIIKEDLISTKKLPKSLSDSLSVPRVFAFANIEKGELFLFGSQAFTSKHRKLISLLKIVWQPEGGHEIELSDGGIVLPDLEEAVDFTESYGLSQVLKSLQQIVPCKSAFLAILKGEQLILKTCLNIEEGKRDAILFVEDTPKLNSLMAKKRGEIYPGNEFTPFLSLSGGEWLTVPIIFQNHVTGIVGFYHEGQYTRKQLAVAEKLCRHIAPSVEKAILYAEASGYLQRFALLTELSLAATSGVNLGDVADRINRMVKRSFLADRIWILLVDSDRDRLFELGPDKNKKPEIFSMNASLEGSVVKIGQSIRVNDIAKHSRLSSVSSKIASKLISPLKFQGSVRGVISLESNQINAFSEEDEQYLNIIASQIASIIENVRLNEHTREQVENFYFVNEIIDKVMGEKSVDKIANIAAELIAKHFKYDIIMVMFKDQILGEFLTKGVSGACVDQFPSEFRYGIDKGLPGEVARTGKNIYVPDATTAQQYIRIPDWEPGSIICVPLRDGNDIFGVINVESQEPNFLTENDFLVMETFAAVFSGILANARHYEELENTLHQFEVVRETALDISADLDLNLLLMRVVTRVRQLIDAKGAELGFVDEEINAVRILVSDNPWQNYTDYQFKLGEGIAGKVAKTGEVLVVNDFHSWEEEKREHPASFATAAGVPLKYFGDVIGTLVVQDDRARKKFTDDDIRTLELLAPQIAVYLRNAMLYNELEERIKSQQIAEDRLIRSAKLAAVGEMAAGVAHELNNPLTTVAGFSELLLEGFEAGTTEHEDMSMILKEAQRARGVVRRLLDFSRQGEFLRSAVEINEVISLSVSLVHHIAQTGGIDVRVELWEDLPSIWIDQNQIQQVFLNIIQNSIQALPNGGELVIRSELREKKGQEWICVIFHDNGIGISEENLDKIFEPFFTTKPSGLGTGLGLSISYTIISEHGGDIEVVSSDEEGTAFTVWLPISLSKKQEGAVHA